MKVAPKKHSPEPDSVKANAPAELLRGHTKSQDSEWPTCQHMWPLLKEHPQPSWSIVAQLLFRAELDVILQVGSSLSTDSYKQTRQMLARHFYPNTTSCVPDQGAGLLDTTLPNLCPSARDFQVLGGPSLPCFLNPDAEETID